MSQSVTTGTSALSFTFSAQTMRVVTVDGEPWFCAADVCDVLGYANSRDALTKHCRAGGVAKRDTPTNSGVQPLTFINEGNLYRLCIKSHKPEAQKFEAWVCDEILPAIRKTGRYEAPVHQPPPARERINNGDLCALIRVVGMIGDHFHQHSAWTQGIWFYLRKLMGHPAPQPWYVDQLPELARHLTSAYADAIQVRALVLKIESEACKRIFRHGEASSVVLADLQRLCHAHTVHQSDQLQALPKWAQMDIQAITSRAHPRVWTHTEAAEQTNYFDKGVKA